MDIGDGMKMVVNMCRPRRERIYTISGGFNQLTIGLKPTQRWRIIGKSGKMWTVKRHFVVLTLTQDEFLELFYRSDR